MAYGTPPFDVRIVGTCLNTFGFTAFNTIEGLGLNSFWLWPCDGIWSPTDEAVTTTWSECPLGFIPTVEDCVEEYIA